MGRLFFFNKITLISCLLGGLFLLGQTPLWGSSFSEDNEKQKARAPAVAPTPLQRAKLIFTLAAQTGFSDHFKICHAAVFRQLPYESLQALVDSKALEGALSEETAAGRKYEGVRQFLDEIVVSDVTQPIDISIPQNILACCPPMPLQWRHIISSLDISDNNLVVLDIGPLSGLKELKANKNKLQIVLGISPSIPLQTVDLSNNSLTALAGVNGHPTLENLELSDNPLGTLDWLTGMPNLKVLGLIRTQLIKPPVLMGCPELRVLNLSENQLRVPPSLATLDQLLCLNLASNRLSEAPAGLSSLTKLDILSLGDNAIQSAPGLESLTKLKALSLAQNGFTELPPLDTLHNLRTLKLQDNHLAVFPDFSHMTALLELRLDHNPAIDIPGLATLTTLQRLAVSPAQWADGENLKNYRALLHAQTGRVNAVRVEQPGVLQ